MAKQPLKYSDIAEKGVLKPLINEFQQLDKVTETTLKAIKAIGKASADAASKTSFESTKDIEDFTKAVEGAKKAKESYTKIEKDQIKALNQLKALRGDEAKQLELAKERIRQQRKALRDNAKEVLANRTAYDRLVKNTREAQKNFKELSAEFGITSKQANEARKQFLKFDDELRAINDAAKDGRWDIGRYRIAIDGLKNTAKKGGDMMKLLGLGLILKAMEGLTAAFKSSDEGAAAMEKTMGRLSVSFQVIVSRVSKALPVVRDVFMAFITDVQIGWVKFSNSLTVGVNKIITSINSIGSTFGAKTIPLLETSKERIAELERQSASYTGTLSDLSGVFAGFNEEVADKVKHLDNAIDKTIQARREDAKSLKIIGQQNKLLADQNLIIDDDAQGFEARTVAIQRALEIQEKINTQEQAIARRALTIANERLATNRESSQLQLEAAEASQAYYDAVASGQESINTLVIESRNLLRDEAQIRLDFFVDEIENRRTANQTIIDDERTSFATRRQLLLENARLTEEAFRLQTKAVNESMQALGKEAVDFDKLLSQSTEEQLDYLRTLGINEDLQTRVLEVIRERRNAQSDLRDSTKALTEADEANNEVLADIVAQEQALQAARMKGANVDEVIEGLEDKRRQNRIKAIEDQIDAVDKGSQKEAELIKERNDLLLEIEKEGYAERLKAQTAAEEQARKRTAELLQAADDLRQRYFDKQLSRIDEEKEAEETKQERLIELAEGGNEMAERALVQSQKRLAELQRERIQREKQARLAELATATLKTYTAKVEDGSSKPLAETITDIGLLQAFIASLPAFKDGTVKVGDKELKVRNTGTDDYLALLDEGERVVPTKINDRLEGIPNAELPAAVASYRQSLKLKGKKKEGQSGLNDEVVRLLSEIKNKPSYIGRDYEKTEKAVVERIQYKNTVLSNHYSRKGFN